MAETIRVSNLVLARPEQIYDAWMSSGGHSAMTGSDAEVEPRVGGAFSAWDGYITGRTLELDRPRRIVQAWRTSEFPSDAPDSLLVVTLTPTTEGTTVEIQHSEIPDGQGARYRQGWEEFYFMPMKDHFEEEGE